MNTSTLPAAVMVTDPVMIFFIVLVIILLSPLLLNRLRIPHIIGMIVAGIVVGPHGVGLLARDADFAIFGQVGILYLMFLAGIEIDMYHLKKNLSKGLGFGMFTFMVPMIVGTVTSWWLLDMDWLTSVLLASMYASHTLIAYPIVSRFGLTRSPVVIITIAGTIVTVLGALIVLAVCVGIFTEGQFNGGEVLRLLGRLVVYCLVVVYTFPRLTRWFFKRYSDNVSQFVYVLAMVFLASWMSRMIGLESVLGAFFAGLVLNRYIPNLSPLMNRIEFVGNAIFIPYFLIGVGMLIDVKVIVGSWSTVYVAAVMTIVATGAKWLSAWFTQLVYGMKSVDRKMMFGLSNAQAAATLAAVMIGFNIGMLSEEVLNGTIVMILITCATSSIVTENAAAALRRRELESAVDTDAATPSTGSHSATLVTVANPLTAGSLVDLALLTHSRRSRNNRLYALHVRLDNSAGSRAQARNALDTACQSAAAVDMDIEPIERYDLNVVTGLINTIEERDITDIVIGMHRKVNIIDSFFGSKIEQLLSATNRMVVIARCFIPINTVTRIVVQMPPHAQLESGFSRWVRAVANLTAQIGCRVIFCCHPDSRHYIRRVLHDGRYEIRDEYRDVEAWDDFLLLANRILDDDLFVVVGARRATVSFDPMMDEMPTFLQKYFSRNNLVVIYPEQTGLEVGAAASIDPLAPDLDAAPSEIWVRAVVFYRHMIQLRKRLTHRKRPNRIDL